MLPRCLTSVAIAFYAGHVAAEPPAPVVVVNHNHSRQAASVKGPGFLSFPQGTMPQTGTWLGLYCDKAGCELREAAVTVMSGTIANCSSADEFAETVYASGNPVAVFNGVKLPLGKVATALLARKEPLASPHFLKLRRLGQWQAQLNGRKLGISWFRMVPPKSPDEYMYRYHVSDGTAKQFIFSTSGSRHKDVGGIVAPFVHWAGDLDRDGKIDLLVEIPYRLDDSAEARCQVTYRLYLSSLARDGEILHKAAQVVGPQPACGC
jgi:hypothetical protein